MESLNLMFLLCEARSHVGVVVVCSFLNGPKNLNFEFQLLVLLCILSNTIHIVENNNFFIAIQLFWKILLCYIEVIHKLKFLLKSSSNNPGIINLLMQYPCLDIVNLVLTVVYVSFSFNFLQFVVYLQILFIRIIPLV